MNLQKILLNTFVSIFLISFIYFERAIPVVENNQSTIAQGEVNYIPYYLKVYEADGLYKQKEYEKCFLILDSLFSKYDALNQDLYYEYAQYISSAYASNQKIDYFIHIEKLIGHFGYQVSDFEIDPILSEVFHKYRLTERTFEKLRKEYVNSKNMTLRDTVLIMVKRDKNSRNSGDKDLMYQIDLENEKKLMYIFNKYGYPNYDLIGNSMLRGKREQIMIDAIIIHMADQDNNFFFKDKLLEFVKKGTCPPLVYALFIDRERLDNGQEQLYCSYGNGGEFCKEQKSKININRKNIGLYNIK